MPIRTYPEEPFVRTWVPVLTNTGGGAFAYTVQAARYTFAGKFVHFLLMATITNAGGGGFVNVTVMPTVPVANGGMAMGEEVAVVGGSISGQINAAGINTLRLAGVGATAVLNYQLWVFGLYESV